MRAHLDFYLYGAAEQNLLKLLGYIIDEPSLTIPGVPETQHSKELLIY